jgi:hypothetical protein
MVLLLCHDCLSADAAVSVKPKPGRKQTSLAWKFFDGVLAPSTIEQATASSTRQLPVI